MMEIQEIEEILQQKQNPHRYRHTIGVRYTSICLAMRYGEDLIKASYAGLLHDCAKHMSGEKLLEKCRSHHLPVSDMEAKNPFLLHGRVGAWLAGHRYGVEDPEILSAIEWHTTGKPDMTLWRKSFLQRIILSRGGIRHRILHGFVNWHLQTLIRQSAKF